MKKLILFFLLVSSYLFGQNSVSVSLTIPPPYSPYFADYTQLVGQNLLTLTNTTTNTLQVKLLGSITGLDNGLFVNTNPDFMPASPIILAPNQTYTVNASSPSRNFLDINNTSNNLTQEQQISIATSGLIPEGNYLFCVRAADYASGEFLSPPGSGCAMVNVTYPIPPILLVPTCHTEVKIPLPAFSWTGVFATGSNFIYDLYILKLSEGQIADDAMWLAISGNVGNPFVVKNIQSTGYQYKVSDVPLQQGAKYAWCVVAREQTGKLKIGNQGRSEVCTFDFLSENGGLVMSSEEGGPAVIDTFNLNNTSISGRILYRYYDNENFAGVNLTPNYNPAVSVGGVAMNALEIAQGQNNLYRNRTVESNSTISSGNGFNQILLSANTANRSTIKIDPSVKYLYDNTLSNNGADPLRNTPVSVYLEYVAITKNWPSTSDPQKEHFQVVPGMELFYDRACQNTSGACLDPQIIHAAEQNGKQVSTYMFQTRSRGSELLGSTVTDELGNFTFDFDLTENTGLLEREESLLKMEFVTPNLTLTPAIDMGQFSPEQVIGNPADGFTGNSMLQGNQGWGGNNALINGLGGVTNQVGGQNLQLNQQQGPSGPAMPDLTSANSDPLNNCTPYTAEYVFKVIRIKVESPLYNSPDILIFAQPGESIMLPTVSTFVNSFDVEYKIVAGGLMSEKDILFLQPGQPISGMKMKQGRTDSFWDSKPDNFPLHEGMDINPASYFAIESETPHFQNLQTAKPNQLRLSVLGESDSVGKVLYKRLVPLGLHYFNAEKLLTGNYNYSNSWGSVSKVAQLPYHLADAMHSFSFRPEKLEHMVKLEPLAPEILVRVMTQSNLQNSGLEGVNLSLLSFAKEGNSYVSGAAGAPAIFGQTNSNGYYCFSNLPIIEDNNGNLTPHRRLCVYKEGYKSVYYPGVTTAFHQNNVNNFMAPLKKGERRFTNEILLEGGTQVYGFVRDEEGRPVTALIQIEDGAFQITENTILGNGYGSPLRRSVPLEELTVPVSGLINSAGSLLNGTLSGSGSTNTSSGFSRQQYARFSMRAPSLGDSTRVIIQPLSDQYFADTFYVNIPSQSTALNMGTFVVLEKLHRVKVIVKHRQPTVEMAQGANVEIGEHAKTTNANGVAYFCFPTPDAYFRVFVQDGTRIPIEEYKYLPVSKRYIQLQYTTQPGMAVSGKVTDSSTGEPLANARIYYQSSNNAYGAVLTEVRSDAAGNYTLQGLPPTAQTIFCAMNHPEITYIGAQQNISNPGQTVNNVNFALNRFAGGSISKIWDFPVELQEIQDLGNGKVKVKGALVSVPSNPNFAFSDEQQRVRFQALVLAPSTAQNSQGLAIYQPEQDNFPTLEYQLRLRLKNAFMADLKGMNNVGIRVKKVNAADGAISGKVKTDLESFRFSFDYNGAFYLGENQGQPQLNALVSKPQLLPAREYFIMDLGAQDISKEILFTVHGFKARANGQTSRLRNDTFIVNTTLLPEIPLSDNVQVEAGAIRIDAEHINVPQNGGELEFKLEQWTVKSNQSWAYSIPLGGILIPEATIVTQMANIPVQDLILRPNEILMQQSNMQLNNLSLGDGTITLHQYPNNKAYFYLDPACSGDLKPHWRFDLYNETSGNPACYVKGLLGFESSAEIKIGAFTVFSDKGSLLQPFTQSTYAFHKVANLSVFSLVNMVDGVELGCAADMNIPGSSAGTLLLRYQNATTRIIKAFDLYVESKGKVYFNASNAANGEGYVFSGTSFVSRGTLHFENDDPNDGKRIELVGILTRKFENGTYTTEIVIPQLASGYQKIELTGADDAHLDVIEGKQLVVNGQWDFLRYTADLISDGGLEDNRLEYVVSGAVEVNKDGSNEIAITDVETPLGALNIVFDWETATFLGTLSVTKTIPIGPSVNLKEGLFEILFSGDGFYFDVVGKVSISGLDAFADLNIGFLTGYHTALPAAVIDRHNGIMSLKQVPQELVEEGIKGLYLNLNFSPPAANWNTTIPMALITVQAGVNLGIDVALFLHFGSNEKVLAIDAGAIASAFAGANVLGVCTFCVGITGVFTADGRVYLDNSQPAKFNGCASLTLSGEACGPTFEQTVGCSVTIGGPESPKLDLQWSPCGSPTTNFTQGESTCDQLN